VVKVRSGLPAILIIFSVSVLVRLILLLELKGTVYFAAPIMDSAIYHNAASYFSSHGRFDGTLFMMSPAYKVFLAGLYSVAGPSPTAVYAVQILLGSFSAVLLYSIADRLFNRTTAVIACVLYLLYGGLSVYNLMLLPLTLIVFLNLAVILALLAARENGSGFLYVLAGVAFALSVMARPNVLLFLVFLVPWFYSGPGDGRTRTLNLAVFALGLMLALLPFSLHRHRTEGQLSPLTSSMGINLHLGNNPDADGIQYIPSPELNSPDKIFEYARTAAESETGRDMDPQAVSNFWMKRALGFIFSRPGQSIPLFIRKFRLFWNDHEVSNNYNYYFLREALPALKLMFASFALLGALGLVGMATAIRRYRDLLLIYGMVLTYNIVLVAFFVLSRYRMPAVPFLILFASRAAYGIISERRHLKAAVMAAVFAVLFLLLNTNIIEQDFSTAYVNEGILYLERGDHLRAEESFGAAIEADPGDATAYYNLAVTNLELKKYAPAEENLKEALRLEPRYHKALNGLAALYTRTERYPEAEDLFLRVLHLNPRDVDAMNNLGVLYGRMGDYSKAERLFQSVLAIDPDNRAALDNLEYLDRLIRGAP
jgi:tetratricopeptide (TPR) repeat protein